MSSNTHESDAPAAAGSEFVTFTTENTRKLKFEDLEPQYRPDQDIFAVYELCNGFTPSSKDWIGLYTGQGNQGLKA